MTENEARKTLEIFDRERKEYMTSMPSTPYFDRAKADGFTQSLNIAIKVLEEIQKYRAIGTVEECRDARERQMGKKPTPIDYKKYIGAVNNAECLKGDYWCPNCKHAIRSGDYCNDCGQSIDWSDTP